MTPTRAPLKPKTGSGSPVEFFNTIRTKLPFSWLHKGVRTPAEDLVGMGSQHRQVDVVSGAGEAEEEEHLQILPVQSKPSIGVGPAAAAPQVQRSITVADRRSRSGRRQLGRSQ